MIGALFTSRTTFSQSHHMREPTGHRFHWNDVETTLIQRVCAEWENLVLVNQKKGITISQTSDENMHMKMNESYDIITKSTEYISMFLFDQQQ